MRKWSEKLSKTQFKICDLSSLSASCSAGMSWIETKAETLPIAKTTYEVILLHFTSEVNLSISRDYCCVVQCILFLLLLQNLYLPIDRSALRNELFENVRKKSWTCFYRIVAWLFVIFVQLFMKYRQCNESTKFAQDILFQFHGNDFTSLHILYKARYFSYSHGRR